MNTRLLLLFLLCGFGASNVFAQQQPETAPVSDAQKTRYYNTVEYVNCKIAQYSVQNTKDAVLQADFMKSCNCNADGGTDANLQRFFAGHHLGKNAKIFKMTDSMKLSYRAGMNGTQLAGLITGYLASSKLADFASNKPTFPDFTKQLAVEVDARFVGANNPTPPPTSGQTSTAPDPIQNATETSDTAIAKFFNYFIVFLLGVLAGAVALRFWQQNKAKVRKNQRVDGENDAPNSPNSQVLEQQITALQRELENQKKLNTQLKMRFDDAFVAVNRPERAESPRTAASFVTPPIEDEESVEKNAENIVDFDDIQVLNDDILPTTKKDTSIDFEIENTISASLVVIAPETPVAVAPETAVMSSRIFFLRLPTKDGLFNDLRKSDIFRPAESVYRMELIDKNQARFAIVPDDETMHRAIQGFTLYLEPACEIIGTLDTNAVLIKTIEEGFAVKEGDIWRITQKAVIDLI